MFALIFRFPAGRYHATPWGRNVNEGAVAWPPEPYRILRALIAVWHRKADQQRFPRERLDRLIERLAASDPHYSLPAAVHAHTRHYMPQAKPDDRKLIFDAFYRINPQDKLIVAWPELTLDADTFALAEHLAERIGYLGRAESLASAWAVDRINGSELPVRPDAPAPPGTTTVDALAPLTPENYTAQRQILLDRNTDRPGTRSRKEFEATVPESFTEALALETSAIQDARWSQPPAGRLVRYARPEVGPRAPATAGRRRTGAHRELPTVARVILAGRPLPPITEAVRIGEVFRRALMARCGEPVPSVLSGRDGSGRPLRDPEHAHAFFLPEDHDQDGFIDHLVLYARLGLEREVRRALEELRYLWIADRRSRSEEEDSEANGRREWRLALEGFGTRESFADSALLRSSDKWVSVTPYLRPRHLKGGDVWEETQAMVLSECERRGLPEPEVHLDGRHPAAGTGREVRVGDGDAWRNTLAFHRVRSRRGLVQPDCTGTALCLTFSRCVPGPIALGFGSHFGLGLFRAAGQ